MGCQTSKQQNSEIVSLDSDQSFKLSYKQLITQDRGHVFDLYHFSSILNRSNYSIIRKVFSKASQQSRICKIVPLLNRKSLMAVSEVEFLKKLDHPNIIQVIEYFLEPSFLFIILEDIPGGRLLGQLNKIQGGVPFENIVDIMQQLLRAVDFCHRKLVAHRAITTENILLYWNHGRPVIKLIDFSQARSTDHSKIVPVLPEKRNIIIQEDQNNNSVKIDIYDCGIVFVSLLRGKKVKVEGKQVDYPQNLELAAKVIKQLKIPQAMEKNLTDLLTMMLAQNPNDRHSAQQCLTHPFFASFGKGASSRKALESLIKFQPENNFKYMLGMYASLNLTSAIDKSEYLTQFYNLDKNKDGEIQLEELIEGMMNTFGLPRDKAAAEAQRMFANLDRNHSGAINFSEYVTGTLKLSKIISNEFLTKMFNEIDINKDGLISEQEISSLIFGIDRRDILPGRKEINFKEFKAIVYSSLGKQGGREWPESSP